MVFVPLASVEAIMGCSSQKEQVMKIVDKVIVEQFILESRCGKNSLTFSTSEKITQPQVEHSDGVYMHTYGNISLRCFPARGGGPTFGNCYYDKLSPYPGLFFGLYLLYFLKHLLLLLLWNEKTVYFIGLFLIPGILALIPILALRELVYKPEISFAKKIILSLVFLVSLTQFYFLSDQIIFSAIGLVFIGVLYALHKFISSRFQSKTIRWIIWSILVPLTMFFASKMLWAIVGWYI